MASDNEREREYHRKWQAKNRDKTRQYQRDYYARNIEKERQRRKAQRERDPEIGRKACGKWRKKHLGYQRVKYQELKNAVLDAYGGVCVCCGEASRCFLTIDHVNNDGNVHRTQNNGRGSGLYRWILKNGCPSEQFQILCYNCNCSKQHDKEGHRRAHPNAVLIDGEDDPDTQLSLGAELEELCLPFDDPTT